MCWSFWGATCYHVLPTSGRLGRAKLKVLPAKSSIAFVSSSLAAAPQLVTVQRGVYAARIIVIFKPIIRVTFFTSAVQWCSSKLSSRYVSPRHVFSVVVFLRDTPHVYCKALLRNSGVACIGNE